MGTLDRFPEYSLPKEVKPQKIIAEEVVCTQIAVSKHRHGKFSGRKKFHKQKE